MSLFLNIFYAHLTQDDWLRQLISVQVKITRKDFFAPVFQSQKIREKGWFILPLPWPDLQYASRGDGIQYPHDTVHN